MSAPLRVALFAPRQERCGIGDYSAHLAEGLRALPEVAEVRLVEAPPRAGNRSALTALRHYRADEARYRALGAVMNTDRATVAHVQHQYFFFGGVAPHKNHARAFLNAIRIPLVMTVHEIALPPADAPAWRRRLLERVNRANFLHPALRRLIVHTAADRERLLTLGVAADRIHVIPVGVPPALPLPDPETARRAWNLEGKRVLTLFGFLSAKKGHRLALEALSRLPEDIVLLFAGAQHPDDFTDYAPRLQADIAARGLSDRVRITGFLPDENIPSIMAATDLALAPFTQSSGSASLAHLLAYARPILASDIPPHQEISRETPACLALFPSGDAEAFASAIQALLADPDRRAELQQAAQIYANRHSYAEMARQTLEIYRLAEGPPQSPTRSPIADALPISFPPAPSPNTGSGTDRAGD